MTTSAPLGPPPPCLPSSRHFRPLVCGGGGPRWPKKRCPPQPLPPPLSLILLHLYTFSRWFFGKLVGRQARSGLPLTESVTMSAGRLGLGWCTPDGVSCSTHAIPRQSGLGQHRSMASYGWAMAWGGRSCGLCHGGRWSADSLRPAALGPLHLGVLGQGGGWIWPATA